MKLKKIKKQIDNKFNLNLFYFSVFSTLLLILGFFNLKISGDFFLSSIISNPVWRSIILGIVVYIFGYKYIREVEGYKEKKEINSFTNILSNLFLLCLGLLAFQSIFGQAFFGFDLANYEYGKLFLGFIEKIQYSLIILAIVFGSLIFWVNREEVESIEEENKKTNNKYKYLLIIIFFIINIYFLKKINILPDETFHLFSAYGINEYGIPNINNNIIYLRGILVSYITSIGTYLNLDILYSLRLPSLIIATIILLILTRIKNSILIILLLISNLFFIEISLYGRFYIYQMLIILLAFLLILKNKNKYLSTNFNLLFSLLILISIFISELYLYLLFIYLIILTINIIKIKKKPNYKIITISLFITIVSLYKLLYVKDLIIIDNFLSSLQSIGKSTTDINFIEYVLNKIKLNDYFVIFFFKYLSIYFIFILLGIFSLYRKNKYGVLFIITYFLLISFTTIKNQPFTISFFIPILIVIVVLGLKSIENKIKSKIILIVILLVPGIINSIIYYSNLKVGGIPPKNIYISQAILIHNDFEKPAKYVNKYLQNKNRNNYYILSSYGISLPHSAYLKNNKIDYMLGGYYKMFRTNGLGDYYELFTKLKSINTLKKLSEINKNKNILIITSYTSTNKFKNIRGTVIKHIPNNIINFLYNNSDHIIFTGRDNISSVYLFKKGTISHLIK